ncbi:forkhead-associated domain-containing protein 1-like isoform X4 [Clytia hemisphaerica]|uniref:forkhead-associated domain-containing protein 1-like isoform X4 n=1 Tax=Clytia hemisphaerica TaxID=252671 RepID=UPI0034D6AD0D
MDENIVAEEQVQQVALQSEPQTNEVVSQEVVASAVTVGVDVDKTLYDAEEFLANFAGLRLENDQLKRSNEELQQQLEKARHDLQQMQLEKSSLEAVLIKEREQHKEALWKVKSEFQKIQEERLQWKEKYLNICMRNGNTTEPIQPGRKRKLLTAENENEEFYTNLAATFGLAGQEEQPVAVIILKKKSGVSLPNGVTDESEMYSGERHEVESFSIGENQKLRETKSRLDNLKARSFTPEDVLQQQQIKTSELQKTKERIKDAFSHTKPSRAESDVSHRTQSPRMDNVKLSSDVETGYKRFFRIPGEPPTLEQTTEKDSEEYKVFVLEDDQSKELSSNPTSSNRENNPRDYSPVNFSTDISIKRHDKIQYSVEHHNSSCYFSNSPNLSHQILVIIHRSSALECQ